MTEPVSVSRRIGAPAAVVFAILADPARHPEIDGSGMVRQATGHEPIRAAGDTFGMLMHNDHMGDYEMLNFVVEYEQDRRIGWEPELARASRPEDERGVGRRPHHRWSYQLTPDGQGTVVTETYDCTQAPDWLKRSVRDGDHWVRSMTLTLENLDRLCASAAPLTA
jgi:Polyketide cyclase / dehydrase and lipid transport